MLTKKHKIIYSLIVILTTIIGLFIGYYIGQNYNINKNNTNEEKIPELENKEETTKIKKELYYTENNRNIYSYGIDRILVEKWDLIEEENIWNTIEKLITEYEIKETYEDRSILYTTKEPTTYDKYNMLICNTQEGNKDIYFGNTNMKYEENFCKNNTNEPFIKTYHILNISEGSTFNYLTIKAFQQEEVYLVKVNKYLYPNLEVNKPYEFTFKKTEYEIEENNVNSLFENAELIKIEYTGRLGLEQINEKIN